MEDDIAVNVIDNGTAYVRAGFPGSKGPRSVNPNVLGRSLDADAGQANYYIGDVLLARGRNYTREYPMEKGVIVNWDLMEKLWNETLLQDMRIFPEETVLIVTDQTFSPKTQREKMAEIFFETFNSPGLKIVDQAVAGLMFLWQDTGIVVNMGYESTRVVPVYNGHAIAHHGIELNYGGKDMTTYMSQIVPNVTHHATLQHFKEQICYVALDYEEELTKAKSDPSSVEKRYELPDGTDIFVGSERFKCGEAFFDPSIIGKADMGLHKALYEVIMKIDPEIRGDFTKNIFMCGGPAYTQGIGDRLTKEISTLLPENDKLRCQNPPGCNLGPYYGASYLPELPGGKFMKSLILKEQYDEDGAKIVHRICY